MKKIIFLLILIILPVTVNAARGCCSHHGGVSHCGSSGRYICRDGTTSPSCTCTYTYYDDTPSTNNSTNNSSDTNNSTNNEAATKPKEELKESEVKENIQEEKVEEQKDAVKEETQKEELIKKETEEKTTKETSSITEDIVINEEQPEEELDGSDILTLLAVAAPGSIAAIAYERKIKKK